VEPVQPDISFTDVTTDTIIAPYLFLGNSAFGPDIATDPPGTIMTASDEASSMFNLPATGVSLDAGATAGTGHVFFLISLSASPGRSWAILLDPMVTSFSDPAGNSIPIEGLNFGSICSVGEVPEPSSLILICAALPLIWSRGRTWKGR
jgi:hypothetical protein